MQMQTFEKKAHQNENAVNALKVWLMKLNMNINTAFINIIRLNKIHINIMLKKIFLTLERVLEK